MEFSDILHQVVSGIHKESKGKGKGKAKAGASTFNVLNQSLTPSPSTQQFATSVEQFKQLLEAYRSSLQEDGKMMIILCASCSLLTLLDHSDQAWSCIWQQCRIPSTRAIDFTTRVWRRIQCGWSSSTSRHYCSYLWSRLATKVRVVLYQMSSILTLISSLDSAAIMSISTRIIRLWMNSNCALISLQHFVRMIMVTTWRVVWYMAFIDTWLDDSIQNALVDLLGYESLDTVSTLIMNRSVLVENIMNQVMEVYYVLLYVYWHVNSQVMRKPISYLILLVPKPDLMGHSSLYNHKRKSSKWSKHAKINARWIVKNHRVSSSDHGMQDDIGLNVFC